MAMIGPTVRKEEDCGYPNTKRRITMKCSICKKDIGNKTSIQKEGEEFCLKCIAKQEKDKKANRLGECLRCKSKRIVSISAHASYSFNMEYKGESFDGYVPDSIGIGEGGDDVEFNYCLDCGQIKISSQLKKSL